MQKPRIRVGEMAGFAYVGFLVNMLPNTVAFVLKEQKCKALSFIFDNEFQRILTPESRYHTFIFNVCWVITRMIQVQL